MNHTQIAELDQVVKRYGSILALDHVSLEVRPGEILGLLGPNGAGKTTCIRSLTGLSAIDAGSVRLFGEPLKGQASRQKMRMGVVPQELAIFEDLNARENLSYFGRLYGLSGTALRSRVDETLEFIGLSAESRRLVRKYSGGMKRRLNIGCALVHKPEFLVMDEPTVGIDPQSRKHILDSVERLNRDGTTVLYTSHYMEEVEAVCDRIIIMDQGRVIAEGTLESLTRSLLFEERVELELAGAVPGLCERVGRIQGVVSCDQEGRILRIVSQPGSGNIARILEVVQSEGILGVHARRPTLEDVFLTLTGRALRNGTEEGA